VRNKAFVKALHWTGKT